MKAIPIHNNGRAILHWNEQKEKIKIKFPQLSTEDLAFNESEKDAMFFRLADKLGVTIDYLQTISETI